MRGTRWLTEDRCDGTVTRVVRGSVEVDDFLRTRRSPRRRRRPTPAAAGRRAAAAPPAPAGGGEGEGDPSVRPAPQDAEGDVIVSAGGTYVARP